MQTKNRDSNVEIMRIVLMIMIILHHIIAYNLEVYENTFSMNEIICAILWFVDVCCIMAVNCFFLVSGYYIIKWNTLKIIRLIFDAYLYYGTITLIGIGIGKVILNKTILFNIIDPIDNYWFISVYLMLMVFSLAINRYIEKMTRKQYLQFVSCAFLLLGIYGFLLNQPQLGLNTGYSIMGACCLYVIGAGMKKWEKRISYKKALCSWLAVTVVNYILVIIAVFYMRKINIALRLLSYSNPLVVLQAMCFLKFFTSLKIGMIKNINKISRHSLAAYYVNSSNWLAMSFKNIVVSTFSIEFAIISAIPFSILSFLFAVSLDIIKCALCDKIETKICKKMQEIGMDAFEKLQNLMEYFF